MSEPGPGPNSEQIRKIGPEWAPEMRQNIGNPYQMEDNKAAPSAPPQGGGASRRPLGVLVVFHLVRISYVLASFPEPVLARFSTKFADSENSLPQGASLKSLPEAS